LYLGDITSAALLTIDHLDIYIAMSFQSTHTTASAVKHVIACCQDWNINALTSKLYRGLCKRRTRKMEKMSKKSGLEEVKA
jgi:hypothetical protein